MQFDSELIARKLARWRNYLCAYRLPAWEEIPDLGLYMEQVTALLKRYVNYLPPELEEAQVITAAAINNYVRKNIMPKPVKKRYYRSHIAYLIMISTMKQCLSIPTLQTMLPCDLSEAELQRKYTAYVRRHRAAADSFIAQIEAVAPVLMEPDTAVRAEAEDVEELIVTAAVFSGFSRLLAEKLLLLENKTLAEGGALNVMQ